MKKLNIPLIIGLIIVLGIISLIFWGEYYAPHDARIGQESVWDENEDGKAILRRAPFPPDNTYLLGTDNGGRDVLSVIMAGARNTFTIVLLATLCRFLIAIPISYFAAFGDRISKSLIEIFSNTFTAVPSLLLAFMVLKVHSISKLPLTSSIVAFVIVFTIIGWGRLAKVIEEKIQDILKQDFIQGEIAIGKSKFAIATKNVTAHLMPSIIIFICLEISLVLLLLAQLGVFEIFVGNKQIFHVSSLGVQTNSTFNFFPEWGAMLASTMQSIVDNKFWLSMYPISAFVISIIGFNLLGQGLNYELSKRNSKFISSINKLWFHLSIKTFIGEVKNFKIKRRIVMGKVATITTILLMILVPILTRVVIADEGVMAHVHELARDEYQGRMTGTIGSQKAGEYIVNQLKNYNVEPLFDDGYISEFQIELSLNIIEESELMVNNSSGEKLHELKYKVEYYFETWPSSTVDTLEGEILTIDEFLEDKFDKEKEYFLVLNYEGNKSFQSKMVSDILSNKNQHKFIKGIIVPDFKEVAFLNRKIQLNEKGLTKILDGMEAFDGGVPPFTIHVSNTAARKLSELSGNEMTISTRINHPEGLKGRNIGGIIKGKSDKNPIIIATTYDYLGQHDFALEKSTTDLVVYKGIYENGTSIAGSLELARNLGGRKQTPDRSIIFIFIDGSQITPQGIKELTQYEFIHQEPLIIYLNYMGIARWGREEDSLYNHTIVQGTNEKIEGEFYRWMRRNSAESNYYIVPDTAIRVDHLDLLSNEDISLTVLQGLKETQKSTHKGITQANLGEIDGMRLFTHVQFLLDSITDIAYGRGWF